MRAISLVSRMEFRYKENVVKRGVAVGDVDNDGRYELVVGSGAGNLTIFKGRECIQIIPGLGFITCVTIGDIFNEKRNVLVVITGDGWCYVFDTATEIGEKIEATVDTEKANLDVKDDNNREDIVKDEENEESTEDNVDTIDDQVLFSETSDPTEDTNVNSDTNSNTVKSEPSRLYSQWIKVFSQRIPANTKDALLEDIDADGATELVLGLTDRVVRSYRWCPQQLSSSGLATNATSSSFTSSEINFPTSYADYTTDGGKHVREKRRYRYRRRSGRLICQNKWECAGQVGSVSVQTLADGSPALMVAQPGGTFMRIRSLGDEGVLSNGGLASARNLQDSYIGNKTEDEADIERSIGSTSTTSGNLTGSTIDYQFLNVAHLRNPNISTEILGDLRSKSVCINKEGCATVDIELPYPYVVATLDGTLMLVRDDNVVKSINIDQQIFVLRKLDITGDGDDNIIACSWSGKTYILDQRMDGVLFQLGESIQTFESGLYTLDEDHINVPCLIYVTFSGKILLYYDIPLTEINCKRYELSNDLQSKFFLDNSDDIRTGNVDSLSRELSLYDRRDIVHYLLYSVKKGS